MASSDGSIIIDVILNSGDLDRNLRDTESTSRNVFSRMTSSVGSFAKAVAVGAAAVAGIGVALGALAAPFVKAAADAGALASQFSQVFGDLESTADKTLREVAASTGILPERLRASFVSIAAFAKTTGASTADALELTRRATLAAADSAAFYDRSIEDVNESLQSFLKGNFENDTALGISATETTRNAAANRLYGKSFIDLSESQKQLTLLDLVEEGNRLSGALGQAARETDGLENVLGNFRSVLNDVAIQIGNVILDPVINGIKGLTVAIANFDVKNLTDGFKVVIDAIVSFAKNLGDLAVSAFNLFRDNALDAVNSIIEAYSMFAEFVFNVISGAVRAISDLFNQNSEFIKTTVGNAIQFIGNAISEFVSAYTSLVRAFLEGIRDAWQEYGDLVIKAAQYIWDNVLSDIIRIFGEIVQYISDKLQEIFDFFEEYGAGIIGYITTVVGAILAIVVAISPVLIPIIEYLWNTITMIIDGALKVIMGIIQIFTAIFTLDIRLLWEGIVNLFTGAIELILGIMNLSLLGGIRKILANLITDGVKLIIKLWDDIVAVFVRYAKNPVTYVVALVADILLALGGLIVDGVKVVIDFAEGMVNAIKNLPSRFLQIGKDIVAGLSDGLKEAAARLNPVKIVSDIAGSMVDNAKGLLQIFSPSRVFRGIGNDTIEGWQIGLQDMADETPQVLIDSLGVDSLVRNPASVVNSLRGLGESITGLAGLSYGDLTSSYGSQRGVITNSEVVNNNGNTTNLTIYGNTDATEAERLLRRVQFGF